ncbi:hypothetical protein RFI_29873 [Reticulomyxa filosa]|uniref:Uncharacterized protein n=1 Tax=Reticulomyxa filosa TaxID=46433 RepID=X6M3C2_RETFI|nr:hypothetical protein RFI_29873 [Reticulomyxa filosa]|eukprot:ETO07520.1 hypothetical protein RFI_29873 [Reticulomyxa filosa]
MPEYRQLSMVDRDVIALTLDIEKEIHGEKNVNKLPTKQKVKGTALALEQLPQKKTQDEMRNYLSLYANNPVHDDEKFGSWPKDELPSVVTRRYKITEPLEDTEFRVIKTKTVIPFALDDFLSLSQQQYGEKYGRPSNWELTGDEQIGVDTNVNVDANVGVDIGIDTGVTVDEKVENKDEKQNNEMKYDDSKLEHISEEEKEEEEEEGEEEEQVLTEHEEKTNKDTTLFPDIVKPSNNYMPKITASDAWNGAWATPENYQSSAKHGKLKNKIELKLVQLLCVCHMPFFSFFLNVFEIISFFCWSGMLRE